MRTVQHEADALGELVELLSLLHADDASPLPWPFLERLGTILDCDCVSFGAMDPRRRRHAFLQALDWDGSHFHQLGGEWVDEEEVLFWDYYWDCAPCSYPDRTGDRRSVVQVADFYSARQWHSTPMYSDLMRGVENELIVTVSDDVFGTSVRLLCLRGGGPPFGDRERSLLTLLRPHVAESYHDALRNRATSDTAPRLTPRQVELLALVRDGRTNRQIARQLRVSEGTVRSHLGHIFERLEVSSRTAAVTRWQELLA